MKTVRDWVVTNIPKLMMVANLTMVGALGLSNSAGAVATERHVSCSCPFCSAATQTLRQELASMDAVAIAKLVTDERTEIDGLASFKIEKVLLGDTLLQVNQSIQATYFGPGKSDKRFLLMGVDPKELVWSSPLPLSPEAEKYIELMRKLPDDPVERLAFYQTYFEHADSLLARDSYDEFALAPYADVIRLKDRMDRKQLLAWVQDPTKSPDRKRLYFTMLGICGKPEDVELFEKMICSENAEARAGLDALIAAYLMLKGETGLPLIEEKFFKDSKTQYADIYSAVMALRFHGTEAEVLKKEAITKAMHQLLARPDLADLVIPDLARWGDWSQIDKLCELFEKATDDNMWVRVPVINYLRSCPLPEAQEKLSHLEKIDPKAVSRAKTFFPIPTPVAPKKGESSALPRPRMGEAKELLSVHRDASPVRLASSDSKQWVGIYLAADRVAQSGYRDVPPAATLIVGQRVNHLASLSVVLIATIMVASVMWMVATSGGTSLRPALAFRSVNQPKP
jgi:hypothetical protein